MNVLSANPGHRGRAAPRPERLHHGGNPGVAGSRDHHLHGGRRVEHPDRAIPGVQRQRVGVIGRQPSAGPAGHSFLVGRGQFRPGLDGVIEQELPQLRLAPVGRAEQPRVPVGLRPVGQFTRAEPADRLSST
jgi:hypothetical protein